MDEGNSDALILPVPPEPFALIVGATMPGAFGNDMEKALRHMGLRPERLAGDDAVGAVPISGPRLRLHFGTVTVLAGCAADAVLNIADPDHPSTSLLAASLPCDWHCAGHGWIFVPEPGAHAAAAIEQPERMREFFKMMVLVIDLFNASHIFWSSARLWSDAPQFRASIAEMLVSGMPPVLHLVAFRRREDRNGASICTRGLCLFAGQELEAHIPVGWTVAEMVRRLSRLALDMMLNGPVHNARMMRGLAPGEWIDLMPSPGAGGQRSTVIVAFGRD